MPEQHPKPLLVRIGLIGRAHGLAGAVRVTLDHPGSRALDHASRAFLVEQNLAAGEHRIEAVRRLGARAISVKFAGVDTCEAAQRLRGCVVSVAECQLPPLPTNEFYYFRALGCVVVSAAGEQVGVVEEIFTNGAHDVLVVKHGQRETLIPVIADIIKQLDFDHRRIVVEPVPGLLD